VNRGKTDERGISPVIGVVLLVGIVVALVAVSAVLFLGLTEERDPAPEVSLSLEADDRPAQHTLKHDTGDTLDGDKVELRGAADPEALDGQELTAGGTESVYPVEQSIEVVWFGENGASYVLWEFEVKPDETVPEPEEGCEWVDEETDSGTESAKVETVVNCDVETEKIIEVQNGGVIVGEVVSGNKGLDADDAQIYGDAHVADVFNLQDGVIAGSATSDTAEVKLTNGTVGGSAMAESKVELLKQSKVEGDTTSATGVVDVQSQSAIEGDAIAESDEVKVDSGTISGAVFGSGGLDLDDATVEGHVYVDDTDPDIDFDCTNSIINGQNCDDYTPKDPDDY
jgi:flagellin-like protein